MSTVWGDEPGLSQLTVRPWWHMLSTFMFFPLVIHLRRGKGKAKGLVEMGECGKSMLPSLKFKSPCSRLGTGPSAINFLLPGSTVGHGNEYTCGSGEMLPEEGQPIRAVSGASLTCGEGSGDEAAPHGVLGSLQAHGVLCGLRKPLQADPRVLGIHNQLLYMGPKRR